MLMERCGEGFWTGDPDIFPTGEGQLGVFSTLGPEPPANLRRKPVCIGERVGPSLLRLPWLLREPLTPQPTRRIELLEALKGPWQGQRKGNYVIWWFLKATPIPTPHPGLDLVTPRCSRSHDT